MCKYVNEYSDKYICVYIYICIHIWRWLIVSRYLQYSFHIYIYTIVHICSIYVLFIFSLAGPTQSSWKAKFVWVARRWSSCPLVLSSVVGKWLETVKTCQNLRRKNQWKWPELMNQHPAISAMTLVTIWVPFGFDSQELSIFYFRTRIQQLNGHILAINCFLMSNLFA